MSHQLPHRKGTDDHVNGNDGYQLFHTAEKNQGQTNEAQEQRGQGKGHHPADAQGGNPF